MGCVLLCSRLARGLSYGHGKNVGCFFYFCFWSLEWFSVSRVGGSRLFDFPGTGVDTSEEGRGQMLVFSLFFEL